MKGTGLKRLSAVKQSSWGKARGKRIPTWRPRDVGDTVMLEMPEAWDTWQGELQTGCGTSPCILLLLFTVVLHISPFPWTVFRPAKEKVRPCNSHTVIITQCILNTLHHQYPRRNILVLLHISRISIQQVGHYSWVLPMCSRHNFWAVLPLEIILHSPPGKTLNLRLCN